MQISELKKTPIRPLQIVQTFTNSVGDKFTKTRSLFRSESSEFMQKNNCKFLNQIDNNLNIKQTKIKNNNKKTKKTELNFLLSNDNDVGNKLNSLNKNLKFSCANTIPNKKYSTLLSTSISNISKSNNNLIEPSNKSNQFFNENIDFDQQILVKNNKNNSLKVFAKHILKCQDQHLLIQDINKFCNTDIITNGLSLNFQKSNYNADTDILI